MINYFGGGQFWWLTTTQNILRMASPNKKIN
jgi:hypothetical protein